MPLFFAGLKLNLSPGGIAQLASDATAANFVWSSALVLYFFAWIWGTLFDVNVQELVYLSAENRGSLPKEALLLASVLFVVGGVLLWVSTFTQFVAVLVVFFLLDHAGWRWLVRYLRPSIQASREAYTAVGDHFGLETLRLAERQICGTWKWWRGAMGAVLIAAMIFIAVRFHPAETLSIAGGTVSWGFIQASSILVWVLAMETWIWIIRLKTKCSIAGLDALRSRYQLQPVSLGRTLSS